MKNQLGVLNEEVSGKTVCDNPQTLHAAQNTFTAADNLNRIKRSLKQYVQQYNNVQYKNGDELYYKRKDNN